MYDHIFINLQINRLDIRPHIKWAVSLVILHMVTSIFLQGLCGYVWVNMAVNKVEDLEHETLSIMAVFLYCCPDYTSYPARLNDIGWETSTIWATIQ